MDEMERTIETKWGRTITVYPIERGFPHIRLYVGLTHTDDVLYAALSPEDATTIANALYEAADHHVPVVPECSGESAGWLVATNPDDLGSVYIDLDSAESIAQTARAVIVPLHRGPIHADYRKPRQCEHVNSNRLYRCWRNSGHQGAHIYCPDPQQAFTWSGHFAGGETLQDAIVAAVRDRDAREASDA